MGVLNVAALPGLLGDVGHVELAGADHHLGGLAINFVTVDVDFSVEGVEGALRLLHLEGVGHNVGIQQPDVEHAGVSGQLLVGDLGIGTELPVSHYPAAVLGIVVVVEAQGIAGGANVAIDVDRLLLRLLWLGLEPLDDGRVDRPHDYGHDHPQPHRGHRQHPAPLPDVDHQQNCRQHRDQQQKVERRQLGVYIGVAGPIHRPPAGEVEAESIVVIPHGPG